MIKYQYRITLFHIFLFILTSNCKLNLSSNKQINHTNFSQAHISKFSTKPFRPNKINISKEDNVTNVQSVGVKSEGKPSEQQSVANKSDDMNFVPPKKIRLPILMFKTESESKMITPAIVEDWAKKISEILHQTEKHVRRELLLKGFSDMKKETRNGTAIVKQMAEILKDLLIRRAEAAEKIMRHAEELAKSHRENYVPSFYTYDRSMDLDIIKQEATTESPWEIPANCSNEDKVPLRHSDHFDADITMETSSVHVAAEVFNCDPRVKKEIYWSDKLLSTFKENFAKDVTLDFQYFCSAKGFLRHYPAASWNSMFTLEEPVVEDIYDCRLRPWYVSAGGAPRDVLIMLDASGSMHNSSNKQTAHQFILALLNTLTDDDYVNVLRFNVDIQSSIYCFNDILVPANHVNSDAMISALKLTRMINESMIDLVLEHGMKLLRSERRRRDRPQSCQQSIIILTDSMYFNYSDIVRHLDPDGRIRIFVMWLHDPYGLRDDTRSLAEWLSCDRDGYFNEFITDSDVTEQVMRILRVMERPLVAQRKERLRIFSDVYAHLEDPRRGEVFWTEKEKAEQKYRYNELRRNKESLLSHKRLHDDYMYQMSLDQNGYYYEGADVNYKFQISISVPVFEDTTSEIMSAQESVTNVHQSTTVAKLSPYSCLRIAAIGILGVVSEVVQQIGKSPGIYFNPFGIVRISDEHLHVLVPVDVGYIKPHIQNIQTVLGTARSLCRQYDNHPKCYNLLLPLSSRLDDITSDYNSLSHLILERKKRSAWFAGIGSLFKHIIGTMDEDDEIRYDNAIQTLETNDKKLASLLKNNILLTDTALDNYNETMTTINRNELRLKSAIERLDENLTNVTLKYNKLNTEGAMSEIKNELLSSLLTLSFKVDDVMNAIMFTKSHSLHPSVLTPIQLYEELSNNIKNIPKFKKLPIDLNLNNIHALIDISQMSCSFIDNKVIFVIKIPLTNGVEYNLYKTIPIPIPHDVENPDSYALVLPHCSYTALSRDKFTYICINNLKDCSETVDKIYICEDVDVRSVQDTPICETEMLSKIVSKLPQQCETRLVFGQLDIWQELKNNKWIFIKTEPTKLTVECQHQIQEYKLLGTGILNLDQNCIGYCKNREFVARSISNITIKPITSDFNLIEENCCNKDIIEKVKLNMKPVKLLDTNLDRLAKVANNQDMTEINKIINESDDLLKYQPYYPVLTYCIIVIFVTFIFYKMYVKLGRCHSKKEGKTSQDSESITTEELNEIPIPRIREKQRNSTRTYPVNRLLGVAGIDIPVDHLKLIMPYHEVGAGGSLFLLDHRGNVVFHDNLRPTFDGDLLKPGYRTVDFLEIEHPGEEHEPRNFSHSDWYQFRHHFIVESKEGSKIMYGKTVFENGMRVMAEKREYFWQRILDHYTAVVVLPKHSRQHAKHESAPFSQKLAADAAAALSRSDFSVHPDWLYCRHVDPFFSERELEVLHFLKRRRDEANFAMQKLKHEFSPFPPGILEKPYLCNEKLMVQLAKDAIATMQWAQAHQLPGRGGCAECYIGSITAFIATESGLTRWQQYHATSPHADPPEGSKWNYGPTEPWYIRAVATPETLVIHAPVQPVRRLRNTFIQPPPLGARNEWLTAARTLSHPEKGLIGVSGYHFYPTHLYDLLDIITNFQCDGENCDPRCDNVDWSCVLVDEGGWIVSSTKPRPDNMPDDNVREHLATSHPIAMEALLDANVFNVKWIHDYQGVCFPPRDEKISAAPRLPSVLRSIFQCVHVILRFSWEMVAVTTFTKVLEVSGETEKERQKRRNRTLLNYQLDKFERLYDPRVLVNWTRFAACDRSRPYYELDVERAKIKFKDPPKACSWPLTGALLPNTNLVLLAIFNQCKNRKNENLTIPDPLINYPVNMTLSTDTNFNGSASRLACWRNQVPLTGRPPHTTCFPHNYTREAGYRQCGPWFPDPELAETPAEPDNGNLTVICSAMLSLIILFYMNEVIL